MNNLLPAYKEQVNSIAAIIKDITDPEMIILFGSYAKGKITKSRYVGKDQVLYEYTSDLDFLVIIKDNTQSVTELEWEINEKTLHSTSPVNVIIHDINFVNEALAVGQYFFSDIKKEGVKLYDTENFTLADARDLTKQEQTVIAQEYFDFWFDSSQEFLVDANNAYQRESLNKAAFYLHQATETLYYTTMLTFTLYKPKTHNLLNLRNLCKEFSKELFVTFEYEGDKEEKRLFQLLKRAYIEARYIKDYQISKEDVKSLLEKVEKMQQIVKEICVMKLASY